MTTALVLTGGGARGAYQAGALVELLPALAAEGRHPTVFCGASVGALNATALAANSHLDVDDQVAALVAAWGDVRKKDVLKPFFTQVPGLVRKYLNELTPLDGGRLRGLIATDPLQETLEQWVDWDQLEANCAADGPVETLVVSATEIVTGSATGFVAGRAPAERGVPVRYVQTRLEVEHLVASASIPLLFEATYVARPESAAGWYCDGSTRLNRPVTPAIDAGADDVVVVSCHALARTRSRPAADDAQEPDLGDVVVNVLEALMTDVLDDDLERCDERADLTVIAPDDPAVLADIARHVLDDHYGSPLDLLRSDYPLIDWALGGDSPRQAELLSYLLFDPEFISEAMARGADDARRFLDNR